MGIENQIVGIKKFTFLTLLAKFLLNESEKADFSNRFVQIGIRRILKVI